MRRHGSATSVQSRLRSVHRKAARATAWRIVLRPEVHYQAPRLQRTAARRRGLASMPFDGALDRVKFD